MINLIGNFSIDDEVPIYIMGHSHAEFAYDDSIISNVRNFSNSAEPYFYTYTKLKKLSKNNPKLETVILEFSNNSISKPMDAWIWGEKYLDHRFTFYAPFLEFDQVLKLLINSPLNTLENYFKSIINNFWKIARNDVNYIEYFGKFSKLDRIMTESPVKKFVEEERSALSKENLLYLSKIVTFCEEYNINLILIRTPQHESCEELANEKTFQTIYNSRFKKIPFLDLQKFPLEKSDFADSEHVNKYGAKKISIWLDRKIKNGGLDSLYID